MFRGLYIEDIKLLAQVGLIVLPFIHHDTVLYGLYALISLFLSMILNKTKAGFCLSFMLFTISLVIFAGSL